MAEFGAWAGEGKLLLETDDLVFRGAARWQAPLRELRAVAANDGWLEVSHGDGRARFDLGAAAEKWAHAILNPRGLLDKLGVKHGGRVAVVGGLDVGVVAELGARAAVTESETAGDLAGAGFDLILYRVEEPGALGALDALRGRIAQNGGIWVVSPKKRPEIADVVVIAGARRSGLVDVKVARFSDTHTALKLVIPKVDRQ